MEALYGKCLTGENIAPVALWAVAPEKETAMITIGFGAILGTLLYGGLLVISMFLIGQLFPIIYEFVSEGL